MDLMLNARLRRWQYWLSVVGIFIGLIVVLSALSAGGLVPGARAAIYLATLLLWYLAMGWVIAARARDAGRNVIGWTLAGLFLPICWIVIGCFASTTPVYDRSALLRTFG
jgi:hypothetical protein